MKKGTSNIDKRLRNIVGSWLFSLSIVMSPLFAQQSSLEIEEVNSTFYLPTQGMHRIRDIEILTDGSLKAVDIMLSLKSEIVMSDAQKEILLNGIPLTFVYDIRLQEKGFWSSNKYVEEIRFWLYYHGLSKQFVVRNSFTKEQHSYPTLSLAILSISTPSGIEIPLEDPNGFNMNNYEGRAKLWLDIEELPTPLRIPAYLSSNWWLNSSWFKWELKL